MKTTSRRRSPAGVFGDLGLRWKILVPFALLSIAYGVSGTYVFSRGTAAEQRANQTARLRDAATVVVDALEQRQFALATLARQVARTEGLADAVARGDRALVRRLALPLALNAGHSLVVTDRRGVALLDVEVVRGARPRVRAGTDWTRVPLIRETARAPEGSLGDLQGSVVERNGASLLAVAAPTGFDSGAATGVALVQDGLEAVIGEQAELTKATLSLTAAGGELLAGGSVPSPPPLDGIPRVGRASLEGRPMDLLYAPVSIGGKPAAVLVVGLPSVSGLQLLGGQAWKIAFLAIAVLLGVFLVGAWVSARISRPLGALLDSTRALQRGELGYRAPVDRRDEVGELAASFNRMAEQLEASHHDLERRVEERTHALEEAAENLDRTNAELVRVSEAKSAFLASMSHELRTPLSGILVAAEMLHDPAFGRPSDRKVRDLSGKVLDSGRHLLGLIEELLDLSRIEAGRVDLRPEPLELSGLLAEVEGAVGPIAGQKGVALQMPQPDGHRIVADPLRMRQVLVNLLMNAVKFTRPGGRVWVEVDAQEGGTSVAVRDTGIGVPRKDQARIFEPFEQVSRRGKEGAGLGLAISKRLVELHGGRLTVSSAPGTGSTFTVSLPEVPVPAEPRETAPVSDVAAQPGRRGASVLLVEDDEVIGELMTRVLRSGGFYVTCVAGVSEALASVDARAPEIVLLDVRLGDSDGLDVVRRLRREPATRDLPVVALSANAMPEDIDRATAAGCNGYLVKPISGRALLEKVRGFLAAAPVVARPSRARRRARGGRLSRAGGRSPATVRRRRG